MNKMLLVYLPAVSLLICAPTIFAPFHYQYVSILSARARSRCQARMHSLDCSPIGLMHIGIVRGASVDNSDKAWLDFVGIEYIDIGWELSCKKVEASLLSRWTWRRYYSISPFTSRALFFSLSFLCCSGEKVGNTVIIDLEAYTAY